LGLLKSTLAKTVNNGFARNVPPDFQPQLAAFAKVAWQIPGLERPDIEKFG